MPSTHAAPLAARRKAPTHSSPTHRPAPLPAQIESHRRDTEAASPDQSCPCGGGCPRCRSTAAPDPAGGFAPAPARRAIRLQPHAAETGIPSIVHDVFRAAGRPLDPTARDFMEARLGHDFSRVRVHTDARAAESTRAVGATAYTVGADVVFGANAYAPGTPRGRALLAHELVHVAQQCGRAGSPGSAILLAGENDRRESEADRVAEAVIRGDQVPGISQTGELALQRKVELRDVGRGEQSGFARVPELIIRLNALSQGLTFARTGAELTYELKPGGTLNNFDRQMMAFIDQAAVIPLRLTNRHGLLGTHATGFHAQVDVDAWTSGYVDIDDLLASTDLGLQSVLVHFLRERSATRNYARRIGTDTFTEAEFQRVHALGIGAEEELLRDYFGDPTIRIVNDSPSPTVRRVFRNQRRDLIRRRVTPGRGGERGVDAMSIDVVTRDGQVHTAEEYRQILEEERIAEQKERERLAGATEHSEGGRLVPAP